MVTSARDVLAGAERVLRAGEVSLMGAIKQALGYAPTTGIMRLPQAQRLLVVRVHHVLDVALEEREPGSPYVSVWAHTRSSVQVADLVEYALAQVSATNLTIRQG